MRRLNWTVPARDDLRSVDAWLTEEASPQIAMRTLAEILERARFLLDFPHGGRPFLDRQFRILRVFNTPYIIIYRIKGDAIDILRVQHERQDWQMEF